ncbi:paxneb protein [Colletotrichum kahawae]|uniref:Elongator complex protein 4 n=1 Tax=Colletotrichum kahawae TaxID=34407 RepID=A0AAD9YU17_COLKA|nr:paxneb protein [Colletotrichum kahawae]
MSFRKKNVVLGQQARGTMREAGVKKQEMSPAAGVRPSPLDGRFTTSTGTGSLDQLLGGHAGLPLGSSILVEESGTTDFAGVLLKYYGAEGLVQGHQVHVLGPTEAWKGELPGLGKTSSSVRRQPASVSNEKMKIAWRYETLSGNKTGTDASQGNVNTTESFCHQFDLSKRLQPSDIKGKLDTTLCFPAMTWSQSSGGTGIPSPLDTFIANLSAKLRSSAPDAIHRVLVPSLLSPAIYGSSVCRPKDALQFLHKLRALLRQYSGSLTAVISISTSLYPRSSGLTRWMELLCDSVLELLPLQRKVHIQSNIRSEDVVQGMLKVHSLPVYHERGGGLESGSSQENLSFRLSGSSGLIFKPYSLPPMLNGDEDTGSNETRKEGEKLDF